MTRQPTVLCIATFPANTGFAWTFLEGLYARVADHLSCEGVRTLVAYPSMPSPPITLMGSAAIPIVLSMEPGTPAALFRLLRILRRERIKTLLFMDRPARHWTYVFFHLAGVERIVVYDHTSGERTTPTGVKRVLKQLQGRLPGYGAELVLTVSDYVARRRRQVGLIPANRIRRLWNGVPVPALEEIHAERMGVPASCPLVLCACRATPEKGVADLLRAFDLLSRNRTAPDHHPILLFAGSGPAMKELEQLRNTLSARERIRFLGYRDDVPSLLAGADLCVVPSVWQDAFPLAVLQAMAMGKPVVATSVGGIPEMIDSPAVGRLVPPGDPGALAAAIADLLDRPVERAAIGAAARRRVLDSFRPESQIAALVESVRPLPDSQVG